MEEIKVIVEVGLIHNVPPPPARYRDESNILFFGRISIIACR